MFLKENFKFGQVLVDIVPVNSYVVSSFFTALAFITFLIL